MKEAGFKSKNAQIYLKNILQHSQGSIYWKDINGIYLGCNQKQADMAGLKSPDEVTGKTDYDMPWCEKADVLRATDQRIIETGKPEELIETVVLSNGTQWVMLTNKAPLYDEEGKIIGIIGTSLDIKERVEAEEREKETLSKALEKYRIYLDNILKNIPTAVYWKDINGYYLGCNHLEAKMAGLNSPEEIIGKTDYDLSWRDAADTLSITDRRVMKTGKPEELLETSQMPNNTKLIGLTNKAPLYDNDGKVIGIIGTSLDITARIEAEKREKEALMAAAEAETKRRAEEEAKRAIMILAGSITHDLRTPLFTLNMINHQLKKIPDDLGQPATDISKKRTEIAKTSQKIDDIIQRMHAFIDHNLNSLKHCTSDALKEETLVPCKSYKCIVNALDAYPFKPGERERVKVNDAHPFDFMGNPILFLRILFNLIGNSLYQIHHNGKGEIFISSEEEAEKNIIRFRDTAGGACAEVVDHIFDGYKTTKVGGTGIGVAFCKLTMESFGGQIACYSVEGDFMEFVLQFPKISKDA